MTAAAALAQQGAPAGTDADAEYAVQLWDLMEQEGLAGEDMIRSFPDSGIAPHGMMLETFYTDATIGGHSGALVIKRNYGPEGVTLDQVLADPQSHLAAVTVMFRRESGYDPENGNWFWAK